MTEHLEEIGVGPWRGEWPTDERYDPELLAHGDRRNVGDQYRYWTARPSSPTSTPGASPTTSPSRSRGTEILETVGRVRPRG
ncbi:hypothetical protein HNR73_001008 [Phytomonospora endophytica]|uniref:Uncharacterized protein n=1 Tax=Phytomonospora endophytica TaxID=714109 RepID=A0A841F7Y8_9ACTN|nr:hypothetical protein [Phytomonospora endophytica]